jgi:hypothetical protein
VSKLSEEKYTHTYPFIRSTYQEWAIAGDGGAIPVVLSCWKPGIEFVACSQDDCEEVCHGLGFQTLTVISRHKPGRYPARVFYTRQWTDPDGKVFGNPKLRITTAQAFKTLVTGYRKPYSLREADAKP